MELIQLLHRAGQVVDSEMSDLLAAVVLTPRQFEVMRAVSKASENYGNNISQTDIVALTGIDRTTVSDIVKRLIDRGAMWRERSARDARQYKLRLTADGQGRLKRAEGFEDQVNRTFARYCNPKDLEAAKRTLNAIVTNSGPISSATVARRRGSTVRAPTRASA